MALRVACILMAFHVASPAPAGLNVRLSSALAREALAAGETAAAAAAAAAASAWPQTLVPLTSPALRVAGDTPPRGLFDPSVLLQPARQPPLLSYSAVAATDDISTHIAAWDAAAAGWARVGAVNAPQLNATLPCAGGAPCVGSLIHEVSTLVAAPSGGLRCFAHSYVVTGGDTLHYDWGHISLWSAVSAAGPWSGGPLLGWAGASPLSTSGVAQVLTDEPALRDCLIFTEPGAAADPADASRTLLALGCVAAGAPASTIRIVLLASTDAAARQWAYLGVLVDGAADAARLGYAVPQLNAADLFAAPPGAPGGPGLLLSVSPTAQIFPALAGYAGCLVLQLDAGGGGGGGAGVRRNASGAPIVLRQIAPAEPAFAGACTAAPGAPGGYLLPVLQTLGAFFSIRESGQQPV